MFHDKDDTSADAVLLEVSQLVVLTINLDNVAPMEDDVNYYNVIVDDDKICSCLTPPPSHSSYPSQQINVLRYFGGKIYSTFSFSLLYQVLCMLSLLLLEYYIISK